MISELIRNGFRSQVPLAKIARFAETFITDRFPHPPSVAAPNARDYQYEWAEPVLVFTSRIKVC